MSAPGTPKASQAAITAVCSVPGCGPSKNRLAKGLCNKHYKRLRQTGSVRRRVLSAEERLLANRQVAPNGCWRWMGTINAQGYGHLSFNGERTSPHRLAYLVWVGPIPDGSEVDHVAARGCRHRDCFRPDHLEAVTHAENVRRGTGPSAIAAAKTHCLRGHAFDSDNTYITNDGRRQCRRCRAIRRAEK